MEVPTQTVAVSTPVISVPVPSPDFNVPLPDITKAIPDNKTAPPKATPKPTPTHQHTVHNRPPTKTHATGNTAGNANGKNGALAGKGQGILVGNMRMGYNEKVALVLDTSISMVNSYLKTIWQERSDHYHNALLIASYGACGVYAPGPRDLAAIQSTICS